MSPTLPSVDLSGTWSGIALTGDTLQWTATEMNFQAGNWEMSLFWHTKRNVSHGQVQEGLWMLPIISYRPIILDDLPHSQHWPSLLHIGLQLPFISGLRENVLGLSQQQNIVTLFDPGHPTHTKWTPRLTQPCKSLLEQHAQPHTVALCSIQHCSPNHPATSTLSKDALKGKTPPPTNSWRHPWRPTVRLPSRSPIWKNGPSADFTTQSAPEKGVPSKEFANKHLVSDPTQEAPRTEFQGQWPTLTRFKTGHLHRAGCSPRPRCACGE